MTEARRIPDGAGEAFWHAADEAAIRFLDWPAAGVPAAGGGTAPPRGSLLFLPGRGDAYEKYLETLAHWHAKGWHVAALDWRGQALSGRLGLDAETGHVEDFAGWIADLADFWAEFRARTPAPHVLVGHSMGGHLALRAVAEGAVRPTALVLSAPMLGLLGGGLPSWLLHRVARGMAALGDRRRPAWRDGEKPGARRGATQAMRAAARMALLTHDARRYADEAWWQEARPELKMGPASWGWIERALASQRLLEAPGVLEAVTLPVFLFGTTADRLVSWPAIRAAARRLPQAELLTFGREAGHEILRESDAVRDRALAAMDAFLARAAPADAFERAEPQPVA